MAKGKGNTKNDGVEDVNIEKTILTLRDEIIDEAVKITTNKVSSCYILVEKTRELIAAEKLKPE